MKKTKTIFLSLLIILLLISGCNKDILTSGDSANEDGGLLEKQTYNIFDFTFYLDNTKYSLPQPLENFIENGWQVKDISVELSLKKEETKYIELEKNDITISASILNEQNINITVMKSTVMSITYDIKNNPQDSNTFKLFDEIFVGQNFSMIESILDKPSKIKHMDHIYIAEYYLSRLSSTEFYFNNENDLLEKIVITNKQKLFSYTKENLEIKEIKNPNALSDLPMSNSIEFYGDTFSLPIKISDLISYDWIAKSDVILEISPNESKNVLLTRDNISTEVVATNNADTVKKVLESEVNSLEYNKILSYGETPFKLPKDITKISTLSDIIGKYEPPFEQIDGYIKYISEDNDIELIFIFDENDNLQIMSFTKITP